MGLRIIEIQHPQVLSKSMVKAMACETHFAEYYLVRHPALSRSSNALAETGTAFHKYRAAYITHLRANVRSQDMGWAKRWLAAQPFSQDARGIIDRDINKFDITPELVFATELFLSVDADMKPLEIVPEFDEPGVVSWHADATDSGTIDLLLIEGTTARIVDYKSGWSSSSVSDFEPPWYAGLVLAHFPEIQVVEFAWEFARVNASRKVSYTRADLPEIRASMRAQHNIADAIADRYRRGEDMAVNQFAGLCGFCMLRCPLKEQMLSEDALDLPPIQTLGEAQRAAAMVHVAEYIVARGRAGLREWININGPVELPNGWEATVESKVAKSYPLPKLVELLGLKLAEEDVTGNLRPATSGVSPRYEMPLVQLKVGSSEIHSKAKAKKRAGMLDELDSIADKDARSEFKIRKRGEREIE